MDSQNRPSFLHPWDVTPAEAIAIQKRLRSLVKFERLSPDLRTVGGCDISFNKYSPVIYAGIIVLSLPDLHVIDQAFVTTKTNFPYIPGLLSFREAPAVIQTWEKLQVKPEVLIVDGQGYAHPRRFGIACHLGVLLDLPTIGCAKSLLTGRFYSLAEQAGATAPLQVGREIVGAAVRTRQSVSPVFVSVGHRATLDHAVSLILRCTRKVRIPEPTRQAHLLVNVARRLAFHR